jgi:UDP-N-acetylglucosamine:LPS N-acetylglucosamine transferase
MPDTNASRHGRDSGDRYLIVSASMGAGHDQVAGEFADRLTDGGATTKVVDLLQVLPKPVGLGLRNGYAGMLRVAPWLYEGIYKVFFVPREHAQPSTSPLVVLAARRLAPVVADFRPTAVVSTFHLAGQVVGRLRKTGALTAPSIVTIVDAIAHNLWLDDNNDLFVCTFPHVAIDAAKRSGRDVIAPGPMVAERFRRKIDPAIGRQRLGLAEDEEAVIVSTGSWGVGDAVDAARALSALDRVRPVVLCGRNDKLRSAAAAVPGCLALGWRNDVPELLASASVLVDNAGGATCVEAFAVGLPVVEYRPIPGHGRAGAQALADAGLVGYANSEAELLGQVGRLRVGGAEREQRLEQVSAIFAEDPARAVSDWVREHRGGLTGRPDGRTG